MIKKALNCFPTASPLVGVLLALTLLLPVSAQSEHGISQKSKQASTILLPEDCIPDQQSAGRSPKKKPAEPAEISELRHGMKGNADACLENAKGLLSQHRIAEGRILLEGAIERSMRGKKLSPLRLAYAHHALGHCLEYLKEGDQGEKDFAIASELYEKFPWPPIPILGLSRDSDFKSPTLTGQLAELQDLRDRDLDFHIAYAVNLDCIEALYRNRKYEETVNIAIRLMERANCAQCPLYMEINNVHRGNASPVEHMLLASLQAFDKDEKKGAALLASSLAVLGNDGIGGGTYTYLSYLDMLRQQAESYFQNGQADKARTLLGIELAELKNPPKYRRRQDEEQRDYIAQIERLKANSTASLNTLPSWLVFFRD